MQVGAAGKPCPALPPTPPLNPVRLFGPTHSTDGPRMAQETPRRCWSWSRLTESRQLTQVGLCVAMLAPPVAPTFHYSNRDCPRYAARAGNPSPGRFPPDRPHLCTPSTVRAIMDGSYGDSTGPGSSGSRRRRCAATCMATGVHQA